MKTKNVFKKGCFKNSTPICEQEQEQFLGNDHRWKYHLSSVTQSRKRCTCLRASLSRGSLQMIIFVVYFRSDSQAENPPFYVSLALGLLEITFGRFSTCADPRYFSTLSM